MRYSGNVRFNKTVSFKSNETLQVVYLVLEKELIFFPKTGSPVMLDCNRFCVCLKKVKSPHA